MELVAVRTEYACRVGGRECFTCESMCVQRYFVRLSDVRGLCVRSYQCVQIGDTKLWEKSWCHLRPPNEVMKMCRTQRSTFNNPARIYWNLSKIGKKHGRRRSSGGVLAMSDESLNVDRCLAARNK